MSSSRGRNTLTSSVQNLNLGSSEDGNWEAVSRRPRQRAGRNASNQWPQQTQEPRAWTQPDTARRLGLSSNNASGSARPSGPGRNQVPRAVEEYKVVDEEEDEDDVEEDVFSDDDDDDDLLSDDYDTDESPSHESKKQHKMLKTFFDVLDKLTLEEINEAARQWHCPACQNGPGSIDWYKGLQPLVTHARTKGTVRVKLHRMFADLLDEELRRKGTSVIPAGESYGKWEGLQEKEDHDIVWPPMVVIMNTLLEKDDKDKWVGMGNQELLDYFKDYFPVRAKHSYGPTGHRGMSVLIFDGSAVGYVHAENLHKHFLGQGTGKSAWLNKKKALFYSGGKRQLYGYLADKFDIEDFNRHCPGKTRLKYDLRSYNEKVLTQMKKMSDDNQQLTWYKSKAAKEQGRVKVLEESFNVVSEKLRQTMEENRIVRQRTTMQHEQNKEEMDFQEQFFNDQIQKIHEATSEKEIKFEKMQQEERKKVEELKLHASKKDDVRQRAEEVSKFKQFQEQEMEKFVGEREELIRAHEDMKMAMKMKHWEEEVQLEKDFDAALTKLMEKYAPRPIEGDNAVSGDRA
ncbi:hypothetical protein RND81_04G215200 [Saponaria officinalis]|uniref:Uncharacterized protein n=1 Tax=Saponaria officinalis TaxID=3572 RepID=A0AAW1LM11_SAPOF